MGHVAQPLLDGIEVVADVDTAGDLLTEDQAVGAVVDQPVAVAVVAVVGAPQPVACHQSDLGGIAQYATAGAPMQPGHNSIPVTNPTPTSNVLVWIATLGTMGGKSRADISEVGLQAAS